MDHRRRGGRGIHSGRRFFPDPQPVEAEYRLDSHPNHSPDASPYPDSLTPADSHAAAYDSDFASRAVTRPANIHALADEYGDAVTSLRASPLVE